MYRLAEFKRAARQRGYGIGGIFNKVCTCPEEGSFEFGETSPPEWSSSNWMTLVEEKM